MYHIFFLIFFSNIHNWDGQIIYNHGYNVNDNATACAFITAMSQVH